jgi:hypothetical protein
VSRLTPRLLSCAAIVGALVACGGDDDDGSATSVTVPAGDPITVEQLVARSSDSPITVRGLLLSTGGETRLCAAILESFPPQCGEPSVVLVDIDPASVDGIEEAGDVIWKDGATLQVQRQQDGTFRVL